MPQYGNANVFILKDQNRPKIGHLTGKRRLHAYYGILQSFINDYFGEVASEILGGGGGVAETLVVVGLLNGQ
jgi:hypothetical protein